MLTIEDCDAQRLVEVIQVGRQGPPATDDALADAHSLSHLTHKMSAHAVAHRETCSPHKQLKETCAGTPPPMMHLLVDVHSLTHLARVRV